jgi:N-acetyl-anhydromuramyl-L-alanine amidase AmpD
VGDFNKDKVGKEQLEALRELVEYLRLKAGKPKKKTPVVKGHKEINPKPTDCPGDEFPLIWLHRTFD